MHKLIDPISASHQHWRNAVFGVMLLCLGAAAQTPLDIRLALVIGNGAYAGAPLPNPANDAKAMGETLRGLGFGVIELQDASKAQMSEAIARMRENLKGKQGVGMLYYAGHGLQLDWRNYMVPVEAKLSSAEDVPAQTVDVNSVIDAFKAAGNRMNILVLDACRDNPFGNLASGKGLAQLDAPPGTFLAYATAPGNVAEDGDVKTGNGLYTQFLLQELKKPTARIEDVFKRVRFQVRQKSQGRQVPWESTSLEDDFVFNTGVKVAARPEVSDRERTFNLQKAEWDKIKDSKNADDIYEYLKKYPNGLISNLAQNRLEQLQKARVAAQADKSGMVPTSLADSLRDGDRYEFVFRDGLTGIVKGTGTAVMKRIGDDLFETIGTGSVTHTITNQVGYAFKTDGRTYDPPWNVIPGSELAVGNKSSARSIRTEPDGSKQWVDVDSRIVGRERITTPLGILDTFKIEVNFVFQRGGRTVVTFWYEPGWSYSVRMTREFRRTNNTREFEIREMTARSRVG